MHNTSPAYDSRTVGRAESGVRIMKEKVRTKICFARELHGVVGKSHVSLPWCVRFAAQIGSRSHRGTDGMTDCRRSCGRSRMPRRYVLWSEKVFAWSSPRERSKSNRSGMRRFFFGIKEESEIAVVCTLHGIVCREKHSKSSRRWLWRWYVVQQYLRGPMGLATWSRKGDREQCAVGCPGCNPRETSSITDSRDTIAKKSLHQAISGIVEVREHAQVYRVPACEIGIKAGGSQ